MTIVNSSPTQVGIGPYITGGNYPAGSLCVEGDAIYAAIANITSAPATFNAAQWTLEVDGVETFAANTFYKAGSIILQAGQLWSRNTDGTSGATFTADASNWTLVSGAVNSVNGQTGVVMLTAANVSAQPQTNAARTLAAAGTIAALDDKVFLDATSAAFSQPLPDATAYKGLILNIKAITAGTNLVTLTPASGQTVNGAASVQLGTPAANASYQSVSLVPRGTDWTIV